jgi:acyl carrier protein
MTDLDVTGIVRKRWCEVLDVDTVADDDSFFLTGGHSLLAVRMTAALRDDLGARIPVSAVFETELFGAYTARVAELTRDLAGTP